MTEFLTKEEREVLDWQYGHCGDFRIALWEAIMRADDSNLERLALGFPDFVRGYVKYINISGWWQEVQEKAKRLRWEIKY